MSLDSVPIWGLFAGMFLVVVISIEAGYGLGHVANWRKVDEKESPTSAIAAAILGLVAFMLAFAFGIASNRFDARTELVCDEANAIRTTFLRTDFLPEPDRVDAKELLREYLNNRLTVVQAGNFEEELANEALRDVDRFRIRMWDMAVTNANKDMNSDFAALYLQSLNDLFNVHAARLAVGVQTRIPIGIWTVLFLLTILGMMAVGYHMGIAASKRSMSTLILALSFALVVTTIASLDRPNCFIKVLQYPLIDLQSSMSAEN
jgi:hypothetical protein